jgi:two-component system cell cycle response regulator
MTARILVVDDNPLNVKLLAAKLTHEYYIVSTAENGLEALRKIENEKPDIILLDVMMPELDGFETCRRLKADAATVHIPIIMVTALSDTADRVKGLEVGADDFLTKPINDLALMARVRSLLRLKAVMDEWRSREATSNTFAARAPLDEASHAAYVGSKVLLLEDSASEQTSIAQVLSNIFVNVFFASTISEAASMAQTGNYDMVFASLDLKTEDGLLICPQLRTHNATRQLPIVLLANANEMVRVAKGLDLGANDYLLYPLDNNELIARTRTQLKHKHHYERLRRNYEDSLALALVDPLTGAFNRRYLDAHMPRIIERTISGNKPLSILMIDIDHFKDINDRFLHANGDIVLRETVDRITNSLRPTDLIVRMGGEEFAVIMPETDIGTAMAVGERLRQRIARDPFVLPGIGKSTNVTVSIGATYIEGMAREDADTLIKYADAALYYAKQNGRDRVVNYGDMPKNA